MRRLVLILLILVLPLQAGWAAAASYCQHEATVAGGWHFGHHEHRHQAGTDHEQADQSGKIAVDGDCAVCHLASTPAAFADASVLPAPGRVRTAPSSIAPRFASLSGATPDRPQWYRPR